MAEGTRIIPSALQGVHDNWHFAPAVAARGFLFCSGIIGTSPDGAAPGGSGLAGAREVTGKASNGLETLVAVRDPEAQFATAFEALRAILKEAGADLCDVVELTTYHVEITRHMDVFIRVRDRYLRPPYPAWTAIGVSALIVPGGLLEIRAVALDRRAG